MPVDPTRIDEFDPAQVPTVGQLLTEIDEAMAIAGEDSAEGAQRFPGKPFFQFVTCFPRDGHFLSRPEQRLPNPPLTQMPVVGVPFNILC